MYTLLIDDAELVRWVFRSDVVIPTLIFGGVVLTVLIKTVGRTASNISRERTRREIAAYIAEGSMTPEQGERLMKAERRTEC